MFNLEAGNTFFLSDYVLDVTSPVALFEITLNFYFFCIDTLFDATNSTIV